MLDEQAALALMKKYGYDSVSLHPYLYKKDNKVGICYSYVDDNFGILERVRVFETVQEMDDFLKEFQWCKANGKNNHVRMILDNYELVAPKVLYLRNEKLMVKGEMFNIEYYDQMERRKKEMDEMGKILLESSSLLELYDIAKQNQLNFFKKLIIEKNELRNKYFALQKEVDIFNKNSVERTLTLLPEALDNCGINVAIEIAIKDQLSQYKSVNPSVEEAVSFIKDVWELNMNLELNDLYYKAQIEENDVVNETRVVDKKYDLMKKLNTKKNYFLGVDLIKKFRKINRECKLETNVIGQGYIEDALNNVKRKYANYDKLDYLSVSEYLKEAHQNSDYESLVEKYGIKKEIVEEVVRLPIEDVLSDLKDKYTRSLNVSEQAILTLYNSRFKKLFEYILQIPDFTTKTISEIINILNANKDFSKIKADCYDKLKNVLEEAHNLNIKNSVFKEINFDSFELFIQSIVNLMIKLKNVNNKMVLNSDITLYFKLNDFKELETKYVYSLTNDLNSLVAEIKNDSAMIGLVLLKKETPVLYSPYYVDFGNPEAKDISEHVISIKNASVVNALIDVNDVLIMRDENLAYVIRYYSERKKDGEISYVDDLKLGGKTIFCKFTIKGNLVNQHSVYQTLEKQTENVEMQGGV